jgi:hypothetical protein
LPSKEPDSRLFVALTVDVDADANHAVPGRAEAVSAGRPALVYQACEAGLEIVLEELEARRLPATLFWEGRAAEALESAAAAMLEQARSSKLLDHGCHGYAHEDFAGADSGIPLDAGRTRSVLERATQAVTDFLGARPRGFRAPYCRMTPQLAAALSEQGYAYDASLTREPGPEWRMQPYELDGAPGVMELALCLARDARGRAVSGYLWQLLEGSRGVAEYVELMASLRAAYPGGLLQIGVHPWHLIVSERGRPLPAATAGRWAEFLNGAAGVHGLCFVTLAEYLDRAGPGD